MWIVWEDSLWTSGELITLVKVLPSSRVDFASSLGFFPSFDVAALVGSAGRNSTVLTLDRLNWRQSLSCLEYLLMNLQPSSLMPSATRKPYFDGWNTRHADFKTGVKNAVLP